MYICNMENWENIKDFEGKYQASSYGRIRSLNHVVDFGKNKRTVKGRTLKFNTHKAGYLYVVVGKKKTVHRIIASTFIPNPDNLPQINHLDGNKANNNVNNLEWTTAKGNSFHKYYVLGYKKTSQKYKRNKFSMCDLIGDLANKIKDKELCVKYNISRGTLYNIKKENGFAKYHHDKLKDAEIGYIKTMLLHGVTYKIISSHFFISRSTIYNIRKSM